MRKILMALALVAAFFVARAAFAQSANAPNQLIAANNAGDTDFPASHDLLSYDLPSLPTSNGHNATRLAASTPHLFVLRAAPVASSRNCVSGAAEQDQCRVHWTSLLRQTMTLLAAEQATRLAIDPNARANFARGPWFSNWIDTAGNQGFSRWNTANAPAHNYALQPARGAVAAFTFMQNDPRGRDLLVSNSRAYWMSRLRAFAFATAYEAQWKFGPLGENAIGGGQRTVPSTSGTTQAIAAAHGGMSDFVMMPLGGTLWSIGEDLIDRHVIWELEGRTNRRAALLGMSVLNPSRTVANLLRGKAPWYRDGRETRIPMGQLPFQR